MNALTEPSELEFTARRGGYDDVAAEYYDSIRHPTCANFREASDQLLHEWLREYPLNGRWICEVGPGRSTVAELLLKCDVPLDRLVLVDSSRTMLTYSSAWFHRGSHLVLGDSNALPLGANTFDLVVSSLGDPYNTANFWRETLRILRPGGRSLFTSPSYQWAVAFRAESKDDVLTAAQFDLADGQRVLVPSLIYTIEEQQKLMETEGLRLDRVDHVPIKALLSEHMSPKLFPDRGMDQIIVTGYAATKPAAL
jgi:ubiquinone/menaquinone biosynthesis C-methylase UbiE